MGYSRTMQKLKPRDWIKQMGKMNKNNFMASQIPGYNAAPSLQLELYNITCIPNSGSALTQSN